MLLKIILLSPFIGSWISTFIIAPFAIYLTNVSINWIEVIRFSVFFDKAIEIFNKIKIKSMTEIKIKLDKIEDAIESINKR